MDGLAEALGAGEDRPGTLLPRQRRDRAELPDPGGERRAVGEVLDRRPVPRSRSVWTKSRHSRPVPWRKDITAAL